MNILLSLLGIYEEVWYRPHVSNYYNDTLYMNDIVREFEALFC